MSAKVDVNGTPQHPLFAQLNQVADGGGHRGDIRWNFEKFVVSADGKKVTRFSPKTKPEDPTVIAAGPEGQPAPLTRPVEVGTSGGPGGAEVTRVDVQGARSYAVMEIAGMSPGTTTAVVWIQDPEEGSASPGGPQ